MLIEHAKRRFKSQRRWKTLKIVIVSFILIVIVTSNGFYLFVSQMANAYEGRYYPQGSMVVDGVNSTLFSKILAQSKMPHIAGYTELDRLVNGSYTVECAGFEVNIPPEEIIGVTEKYFTLFHMRIVAGSAMQGSRDVVLGTAIFNDLKSNIPGFGVGSQFTISAGNVEKNLTVVGVVSSDRPGSAVLETMSRQIIDYGVFVNNHTLLQLFGTENITPYLIVKPDSGYGLLVYYELNSKFKYVDYPGLVEFRDKDALAWLGYFLNLLTYSALISGALAIFASAVTQIKYSETEFGVFKCAGISSSKIFLILLLETLFLLGISLVILFLISGFFLFGLLSLSGMGMPLTEIVIYGFIKPVIMVLAILMVYPIYGVIKYYLTAPAKMLRN